MFKLPRDLERKRKAVDALYEELVSQASGTEEPLPPKYEDPAVSLLKRVSKTGAQILELEKELEALKTAIKKEGKVSTQGR